MPSIIPGYTYDIFISYRQKDNKGDKWVSTFVEALKTELEATFKEDISVYFDENPHDRLQETHDVDKSLEGKLKCLIFIPILSQTYCDPNSYAWQYEFLAFLKAVKNDSFGKDIKLRGGNVASRILPIRIHDLEPEDVKMFEKETGGVLRALDFIFRTSSGVSRPLKANEDHPHDNLNKTYYSDQINKVGHSIKEIIQGMKAESAAAGEKEIQNREQLKEAKAEERTEIHEKKGRAGKGKLITLLSVAAILIIGIIILYPKVFKRDTLERLKSSGERISVAVMPFQNMTNDSVWNVWQSGIQDILISYLSNTPEDLKVRQSESINGFFRGNGVTNYSSITPSVAKNISHKLDADVYISGRINQSGSIIRINAKLTDSKTEDIIKSLQVDGKADSILPVIDSLSGMISKFLIITKLGKKQAPEFQQLASTNSPEAYKYLTNGDEAFYIKRDYPSAAKCYSHALSIDSNFTVAAFKLSFAYIFQNQYDQAKKCLTRAYQARDQMSAQQRLFVNYAYAWLYETPYDEIKYLKQALEFDDQMPFVLESLGYSYEKLFQYEKEIPEYEKALKIYKKWGVKPPWVYSYVQLGTAYHHTGLYKKERKLYKDAEQDFPDDNLLIRRQAILSLAAGDEKEAKGYIEKYISISKENSASEAAIASSLGLIYEEAGILDKAEEYFRQALSLQPENPDRLNNLAWFLIDKDRNMDEGMVLINKALEISPNESHCLDTKGWGLYKKGNYKEALEILNESWQQKTAYDYEIFLHLEAAKKAVGKQ